jgi:ABC-type thiamine transport system ATPase subunit
VSRLYSDPLLTSSMLKSHAIQSDESVTALERILRTRMYTLVPNGKGKESWTLFMAG